MSIMKIMTFENEKYYKPAEARKLSPILATQNKDWLYKLIAAGKIKAVNMNVNGQPPRYIMRGSDLNELVGLLENGRN